MGAELIGAAKKCEAMTVEVHNAIAFMRDTAASYREEAKKIFKRIEDCALFTEDVRKTCETVKRRIAEDRSRLALRHCEDFLEQAEHRAPRALVGGGMIGKLGMPAPSASGFVKPCPAPP